MLLTLCLAALIQDSGTAPVPTKLERPAFEPTLTAGNWKEWREHLRPRPEDLAWEEIGWLACFSDGIRAADREQAPLLFWAMNGHPLGCT